MSKKAIIIGAGPAGLTAAYELLKRTDIQPIVLEKSGYIGGISRTINYKGNRMDMGPHRFFSKSDRVMDWWLHIMPLQETANEKANITYQKKTREIKSTQINETPSDPEKKMLLIQRLTRIYFLRKFFAYPVQLSIDTLRALGLVTTIRILLSFLRARLLPREPVITLEDFIINHFGRVLYELFFKDYTEKVWGVPCNAISAEWGAQRIKGLSLSKAVAQAVRTLTRSKASTDLAQKETETSLIEQFLYPKHGPGSLWEEVARQVEVLGGRICLNQDVTKIRAEEGQVRAVHTLDSSTGQESVWKGDYFFSTMPVQELIAGLGDIVPGEVRAVAAGLQYRDFINVGILLKRLSAPGKSGEQRETLHLKDNWIYIQERDVSVGRLMIYNNWGDGMIRDQGTTWIGMEYFCNKTDAFWALSDDAIQAYAIMELEKMELAGTSDVLDSTVCRMEKTYPAYFGTYEQFDTIRNYTDGFANLFLVGRNGMHKYNNADHSMLTAMIAVDNICADVETKTNIWAVNTEQEYHEEKKAAHGDAGARSSDRKSPSFGDFVWRPRWNKAWCLLALAAFLLQFSIFKSHYPYANYMPDSYSYLEAAYSNADINMWPVAYSKFLRLASVFTHSDKAVVAFQYLFLQVSALVFLFTLLYFLRPQRTVKNILLCFFIFNPLPLYVSNYISADALFIGMSLLWITSLVWIVYRSAPWQIPVQAVILLACFTLRYNAIYYPAITFLAYMASVQSWRKRAAGVGLSLLLVYGSYSFTSQKMKELTGQRQFSAFGGWQLANNALYMYQHIPPTRRKDVPARFAKLDTMVRQHMDTLGRIKFSHEDSVNSFFYLWSGRGPLIQYLRREWKKDSTTPYFKRWASEGPLYLDYAFFLIRQYPMEFVRAFLAPNAIKLAVPPEEFLGTYNMGEDSVGRLAKDWFQYKSLKVKEHNKKEATIRLVSWYPVFSVLVNLLLVIHLIGLLVFGTLKKQKKGLPKLLLLTVTLWILNGSFSIFASPIVLRYQLFPIMVIFCMALLAGEAIYTSKSKS